METFQHCFTVVNNRKNFCKALWYSYLYIYAPHVVSQLTAIAFLVYCAMADAGGDPHICAGFAVILSIFILLEFPIHCKRILNVVNKSGIFEKESCFHFYEDKCTHRCGENETTTVYSCFTGYFRFRGTIFLLMGKQLLASAFAEHLFADKIDGFIDRLERSGVKPQKFFTFSRWLKTVILTIVFAVCSWMLTDNSSGTDFYILCARRDPGIALSDGERKEFITALQNSKVLDSFSLMKVVCVEDIEVLDLLLAHANDIISAEQCGEMAALSCDAETMKRVLRLKNATPDIGRQALFIHASHPDCSGMEAVLSDCDVDVNEKDHNDLSPVYYCAFSGTLPMLKKLSAAKADLVAKNYSGRTPLHFAASRHDDDIAIAEYLLTAGCDINARDVWGNTALFYAHSAGNRKLTEFLLRSGADAAIKNNAGMVYDQAKLPGHLLNIAN